MRYLTIVRHAKADGRGRARLFETAMDENAQARRQLERDIAGAASVLFGIADNGFSVIDLYDFFFAYLKECALPCVAAPELTSAIRPANPSIGAARLTNSLTF